MLGDFWNNFILQTLNHIAWYFPCLYARFNCSCFNSGCFNDNFQLLLKVSCQINQSLTQGIKAASFSIVFISRLDLKLCFFWALKQIREVSVSSRSKTRVASSWYNCKLQTNNNPTWKTLTFFDIVYLRCFVKKASVYPYQWQWLLNHYIFREVLYKVRSNFSHSCVGRSNISEGHQHTFLIVSMLTMHDLTHAWLCT